MTITLGTVDTGTHLHGSVEAAPYSFDAVAQPFFGLTGEYHLLGKLHGRDLSCWLLLYGFSNHKVLTAGVTALNDRTLQNGTLTHTINSVTTTFTNTVFLGFAPEEPPWKDAAGVNGWQVRGMMKFRQVKS